MSSPLRSSPRPRPGAAAIAPEPARPPGRSLAAVGGVGAVGLGLSALHLWFGIGLDCPFRALTGWLCPLCGGTRAGVALLTGQWSAAWRDNPLLVVLAGLVALRSVGWAVELWRRPRAVSGRRLLPAAWSRHWLALSAGVALVYTVWRNL